MRYILFILQGFLVLCLALSCSSQQEEEQIIDSSIVVPTMVTHDVSMLISDSGVIKYRATTPTWISYDQGADEPYQYFPDGIDFERIDSVFNATETIVADTAYNFEKKQLWHLIRNVEVTSVKGERFSTQELFWDMKRHTVYSDSFIRIERNDNVIEGYGFTSTDDFSNYTIRQTNGVFRAKEQ